MKMWKKFQDLINPEDIYLEACKVAGIEPTDRQFAKWLMKKGKAYSKRTTARKRLVQAARCKVRITGRLTPSWAR